VAIVRRVALIVFAVVFLAAAVPVNADRAPVLIVSLTSVSVGDTVVARIRAVDPRTPLRFYLIAQSRPAARAVGVTTTDQRGQAVIRFRFPRVPADIYRIVARRTNGAIVARSRTVNARAFPPSGFGQLGAAGCVPASPRVGTEAFGTATGSEFWGLFAFNPGGAMLVGSTLSYEGLVGKEVKIVFRMTRGVPKHFYAISPGHDHVAPVWGPERHIGSSWRRPGQEWGAGFVFDVPGCWQIHAVVGGAVGDLFLDILS
jgi:hypothetical protein